MQQSGNAGNEGFVSEADHNQHDRNQQTSQALTRERVYAPDVLIALAEMLPRHVAEDNEAILLEDNSDGRSGHHSFVVGMTDPSNFIALRNVARALHVGTKSLHAKSILVGRLRLLQSIAYNLIDERLIVTNDESDKSEESYHSSRESVRWASIDPQAHSAAAAQAAEDARDEQIRDAGGTLGQFIYIIEEAFRRGASDIHFEPGPVIARVRLRIDGLMYTYTDDMPMARFNNHINAAADLGGVNSYHLPHEPCDAAITLPVEPRPGKKFKATIRFASCPALFGVDLTLRLQVQRFRPFEEIGYEREQLDQVFEGLKYRKGVILVTGETGSGKSNSLEAFLRQVEEDDTRKVIQPSDPIEFPNPKRTQIPIHNQVTWQKALTSSLRKDPNIFSPGEFRNEEEARFVYRAADTGHLVLTTVHTNDVASTFGRLRDLGIENYKLGRLTRLIVSQELIRKLCVHCKEPDPDGQQIGEALIDVIFPHRQDLKTNLKNAIKSAECQTPFYHAVGCARCFDTGYKGRTVVAEVLHLTKDICHLVARGMEGEETVAYAVRELGMMTLAEAAARKLIRGETSFTELDHFLVPPSKEPRSHKRNDTSSAEPDAPERSPGQWTATTSAEESLDIPDYIDVDFTDVLDEEPLACATAL